MKKGISEIYLISILIIEGMIVCSCRFETKSHDRRKNFPVQKSPFDTILGDKLLNIETGELRRDNFKSLLKIKKNQLEIPSTLYDLKQLDTNHFVLSPKKNYIGARNFNVLIKTNDLYVIDYVAYNDFFISDIKRDSSNWVLLLSDFFETNKHWKSNQQLKIVKIDSNFNEIWSFTRNSTRPLSGRTLKVNHENYSFDIEVITSCHICYALVRLVLTKRGQFSSVVSIGKENSSLLDDE